MQELHLLEMLCTALDDISQESRYSLFNVIFGGKHDIIKTNLLTKLVSLALSVKSGAVLDCTALWMQVFYLILVSIFYFKVNCLSNLTHTWMYISIYILVI
jgi:hypothetical protein